MQKLNLLITNDDGHNSPLLHSFVNALQSSPWLSTMHLSVPAEEQSWISHATTRFRPLTATPFAIGEHQGFKVNGTPADCAALGIGNLFGARPDYLFSGINLGWNAGLAYYICSGTVGAARQAFLMQVRAIAFSAKVTKEVMEMWLAKDFAGLAALSEHWQRLADTCCSIANKLINDAVWQGVDLFSVNLPWEATPESERVTTSVARTFFESLFVEEREGTFNHQHSGLVRPINEPSEGRPCSSELPTDIDTVEEGKVSISPIVYHLTS